MGKDLEDPEKKQRVHTSDSIEEIHDVQKDLSIAQFSKMKSEWIYDRNCYPNPYTRNKLITVKKFSPSTYVETS